MTVDWSPWLRLTTAEQAALWRSYREIVAREVEDARLSRFARMDAAIRDPHGWREWVPRWP
jgi:hypothetical protein